MDVCRAVAALLLLGLLVSCSDDEPSSEPPEPTGSATVSPSPTETGTGSGAGDPVLPAGATNSTVAGAEAFLRYYWDVVEYAHASGDTQTLASIAMPACGPCKDGIRYIRRVYGDGGEIRDANFTIQVRDSRRGVSRGITLVFVRGVLSLSPYRDFYGKGSPRNKHWEGGESPNEFVLEWVEDQTEWRMSSW